MNKKEFMDVYKHYENLLYDLWIYHCLDLSGFNKETAYKLINLVKEINIKDDGGMEISTICDYLFEMYSEDGEELFTSTPRELLRRMY